MEKFLLNNGNQIPKIGMGTNTFGKKDMDYMGEITEDTTELKWAIEAGYRHFDTAIAYRNERVIGKAVVESEVPRSEFFITSKIPGTEEYLSEVDVQNAIDASLLNLNSDYIDLYLIHHPFENNSDNLKVWRVLEENVKKGKLLNIGVSNFNDHQLESLFNESNIKPCVNQIESHPGKWNDELITFGNSLGIQAEAWFPLKKIPEDSLKTLIKIGQKYKKSWAQIVLRYQIQRGVVVLPKSHNELRQRENIQIFDFELGQDEMKLISSL